MSYKSDELKLPEDLDLRVKVLSVDRAEMRRLRGKAGRHGCTYQELGTMFGVTRQCAFWICNPKKYEAQKKRNRLTRKEDPEAASKAVSASRKRKNGLAKKIVRRQRKAAASS